MVCGNLVYFLRFGMLDKEKSGNPAPNVVATFQDSA
jgi:hypothetical protein